MNDKERVSVSIYKIFEGFKDTFTLPTDATLEKTLKFSALLLVCSILSELLGFYTFLSWQGCLLCTGILVALLWVERRENDALLRMYRDARVSAKKVMQRAKDAGASYSGGRRSSSNGAGKQKTGSNPKRGNNSQSKRRNGSTGRSGKSTGRTRTN